MRGLFLFFSVSIFASIVSPALAESPPPSVPPGYEGLPQSAEPPPAYVTQTGYLPPVYVVVSAPPPVALVEPSGPSRSGFALELGLGLSFASFIDDETSGFGLSLINASIGGYLSSRFALLFNIEEAVYFASDGDVGLSAIMSLLAEYWVTDRLGLGASLGFGFLGLLDEDGSAPAFVVGGRLLYDLAQSRHHSLTAVYDVRGAWAPSAVAMTLSLQWQYH